MKTLPLLSASAYTAIFFLLGAVGSDFSVDAAALSAATDGDRSAPSPSLFTLFTKSKTFLSKLNPRAIYPTAIGRDDDDAATHSGTGGSLHGIVGQVERNLTSRRLLINQDEAAKRVRDAIAAANQAVDNGESSGVALPLDYVSFNEQVGRGFNQFLTVRLRLPGVDRDLNALVDTGSSSLAFCDKSLIEEAKNIKKTTYAQCNAYSGDVSCLDGSTGASVGFAGQIFQGDVAVYTDQGEMFASMDNVSFTIMDFEQMGNPCFGPLDGIFGVAYKSLNKAVELPSPDFNTSSLWNKKCVNPNQFDFSQGYETLGYCNTDNMTVVYLNPPLEQSLVQAYNSGQNTVAAFGLYLDYAAAMASDVGTISSSLGIYFGGDLAYNNQFYNNGKVQVADTFSCGEYTLNFTSIRVPALNVTQSTVDLCKKCGKCITDTGNSWLMLPLPQDYCNTLIYTNVDELKELGSLFIDLPGADGKDITLSFPLLWLAEQIALGHVLCTGTTGRLVLGLPISQYYYTVYDMGKKTISFVELNLSNETKAFIDGPELGGLYPPKNEEPDNEEEAADGTTAPQPTPQPTSMGGAAAVGDNTTTISPTLQPTSMGCFHHTTSLILLAWTVFVPSAVALITSLSLGFI